MTKHMLDAKVFLQARQNCYALEFCPEFWQRIEEMHEAGPLYSIGRVRKELSQRQDDVSTWCREIGEGFSLPESDKIRAAVEGVHEHICNSERNLSEEAIRIFMRGADPYLVAHGQEQGFTVVTQESRKKGKIRIPYVCKICDVKCMNTHGMLLAEGP